MPTTIPVFLKFKPELLLVVLASTTCNVEVGTDVPIPTLPAFVILILSTFWVVELDVKNCKSVGIIPAEGVPLTIPWITAPLVNVVPSEPLKTIEPINCPFVFTA